MGSVGQFSKIARLGGGQAFGPPFHPVDFPKGNPEEYPYFPSIG